MLDLKTLQYPRHIHRDGQWKLTPSWEACDAAMDEGWVLSPGDLPRETTDSAVDTPETADTSSDSAPDTAPVALRRKPGRPRMPKE